MPGKYPVDYFGSFKKGVDFSQALKDKKIERSEIERKGGIEERSMKVSERQTAVSEGNLKLNQDAVPTAERGMSQEQLDSSLKQIPKIHTPISKGEYAVMDSKIRNWSKANGMPMEKALAPFKNFAQNLTQTQGYTRYQTFKASVENWDNLKVEPLKAIQKALDNATELGDTKGVEKFAKMIDAFDAEPGETPEVLKVVFAESYQHDQDLKRKAALPPPKSLEEGVAREAFGSPPKMLNLWREMLKRKGRGGGAAKMPNNIKLAFDTVKMLTKGKASLQDQIMAGLMKGIPGMEGIDISNNELSDTNKMLLDGSTKIISEFLQLKNIKPKGKDREIVRTGKDKSGKKVVQYSDGTIEYAP